MKKDILPPPTAPSPLVLPVAVQRPVYKYYFIIKKRNFWCYKNYLQIEVDDNYIYFEYSSGTLQIPKTKHITHVIQILNTIGIKNKAMYKLYVMKGEKKMSKKYFYNILNIVNYIFKVGLIMMDVEF